MVFWTSLRGVWLYGYTFLPMHHTHGRDGIDKASPISFATNINALQESNASGKSILAPHPDYPDNWKQCLGRHCISLPRKQVITSDKSLLSLLLNFEEWLLCTPKHSCVCSWLWAIYIITDSSQMMQSSGTVGFPFLSCNNSLPLTSEI